MEQLELSVATGTKSAKQISKPQVSRSERDVYKIVKKRVLELEDKNDDSVYIFRSVGSSCWWKVGGNSALFLINLIGPNIKKKYRINPDNDHFSTFKSGVISVRDIEKFKKNMEEAGLVPDPKNTSEAKVLRFVFTKKVEQDTIRAIQSEMELKIAKVNKLVETKQLAPRIHILIRDFQKSLWFFLKHKQRTPVYAQDLLDQALSLKRYYSLAANGMSDPKEAYIKMSCIANDLVSDLAFLYEVDEISFDRITTLDNLLAEIKSKIRTELRKIERKEKKNVIPEEG